MDNFYQFTYKVRITIYDIFYILMLYIKNGNPMAFSRLEFIDNVSGFKNLDYENQILFDYAVSSSLINRAETDCEDILYFIPNEAKIEIINFYYEKREYINDYEEDDDEIYKHKYTLN